MNTPTASEYSSAGTPASPDLRGWTPPAAPRELEAEGGCSKRPLLCYLAISGPMVP